VILKYEPILKDKKYSLSKVIRKIRAIIKIKAKIYNMKSIFST